MSERTLFTLGAYARARNGARRIDVAVAQINPWSTSASHMRSMTDDWSPPNAVGQLASDEGVYVNAKAFKINKGTAKGDPAEQIKKAGAREVSDGAIIFRSGEKLYIVDGKPPQ